MIKIQLKGDKKGSNQKYLFLDLTSYAKVVFLIVHLLIK